MCELYPNGGLGRAVESFDQVYNWAKQYPFSSLRSWAEGLSSPILHMEEIDRCRQRSSGALFPFFSDEEEFKSFSREVVHTAYQNKKAGKTYTDDGYIDFVTNATNIGNAPTE